MYLTELIEELLQGLEEHGDLEVVLVPEIDSSRKITKIYVSGDREVCIAGKSMQHLLGD